MTEVDLENKVTILHFNDVYNIQDRKEEPVGGAARFATALNERKYLNPMVVFSGDAFNPSIMSSFFKGRQMVAVLNALDVDIAVYGNHDFDFGVDKVVKLVSETKFPWLLSNVIDNISGQPLADGKPHHIMEWNGKKIGFMGLVEREWIDTLSTIDPDDITYLDFVEIGNDLVEELREEGADYIIALTHMRWPNDTKLAQEVEGIDLILGGHDHDFNVKEVNGKYIIKSGTDFRYIGHVTIDFTDGDNVKVDIDKVVIDKTFDENIAVKEIVTSFSDKLGAKMDKVLGVIEVDLDGRFSMVRTGETNLGNFIADIMQAATDSDGVILNGGTLRSDMVHSKGNFTMKDMMSILPFGGSTVVLQMSGKEIHKALEVAVAKYPVHEGRFAQVSGISFGFDPDMPANERVDHKYIKVQGKDLNFKQSYKVSVTDYLASGKDGYEFLQHCPQITPKEEGPVLHTIIQNHFQAVRVAKGEKKLKYCHHQAVCAISRMKSLVKLKKKQLSTDSPECGIPRILSLHESFLHSKPAESHKNTEKNKKLIAENVLSKFKTISSSSASTTPDADVNSNKDIADGSSTQKHSLFDITKLVMNMNTVKRCALQRQESRKQEEREALPEVLAPKVEGRIFILNKEKRIELDRQKEADLGEDS